MHAYRRFVEEQMSEKGWTRSDLARHAGLTKQTISNIVNDKRPRMDRMPSNETVAALSRAFGVPEERILACVGEAMGLPLTVRRVQLAEVPHADLLRELQKRLDELEASHDRHVTQEQEPGQEEEDAQHESADRSEDGSAAQRSGAPMSGPDFYALAADDSPSMGRALRAHLDEVGEEPQD